MEREELAADVLTLVEEKGISLREGLNQVYGGPKKGEEARSAVHALTFETIRHRNLIDAILNQALGNKSLKKLNAFQRNLLRIATYRIKFEKEPAALVTNAASQIASNRLNTTTSAFVNAVLHKTEDLDPEAVIQTFQDEAVQLGLKYFHPTFLVRDLMEFIGEEETKRFLEANNRPRPRHIRLNLLLDHDETLRILSEEEIDFEIDSVMEDVLLINKFEKALPLLQSYQEGRFYLQDRGSALISHILSVEQNDITLDACAAPGGKTTHLASLQGDMGRIIASDRNIRRLQALVEKLPFYHIQSVHPVYLDFSNPPPLRPKFDRVLVDAPCSGSGSFSSRPESKWKLDRWQVRSLSRLQLRILSNASTVVKEGGILLYATCSVLPIENEEVIQKFLESEDGNNWELLDAEPFLGDRSSIIPQGQRLFPHKHNTEGFSIFKMQRV
ncbi:MAG: transcription antitermination factor NusB [Promethearchaeota archaeon]